MSPHRSSWIHGFAVVAMMRRALSCLGALLLAGCASSPPTRPIGVAALPPNDVLAIAERLTWGANGTLARAVAARGFDAWLAAQLHPSQDDGLPEPVAQQIAAFSISRTPTADLVRSLEQERRDSDAIKDDTQKKAAQAAYQQHLSALAREAAARSLLRDVYSRNQLQEQMTWFWLNHFNVHQYKANLRVLVGDYEDRAIRPYALGRFRDLVGATLRHPAMIRYLDNEQNAAGRLNENYARELLELHTLGVDGGYSQKDVQEVARVLTGVGVNLSDNAPKVADNRKALYVRDGLFEFNPMRHDMGEKVVLKHTISPRGMKEVDQVLDIVCREPATARFVSRRIAAYFVADAPPPALVDRMAQAFLASDGDIAKVIEAMVRSPEFAASLGTKFKDPMHYVVSSVRLAYEERPIRNAAPMINWLNRLGQGLYNRQTPDGYALDEAAWASPGQMTTRFEIARQIAGGSAGLFKPEGSAAPDEPAFPRLASAYYYQSVEARLRPTTKVALDQAATPQEWGALVLASPDFMYR